MPERIEATLLVVQPFRDTAGVNYRAGDRADLKHRSIRQAALDQPELFRMEYETAPVDVAWLRRFHDEREAEYAKAKRARDERRERAPREELEKQNAADRDSAKLERRYEKQEADRRKREQAAQEERERQRLEFEFEQDLYSGFNY